MICEEIESHTKKADGRLTGSVAYLVRWPTCGQRTQESQALVIAQEPRQSRCDYPHLVGMFVPRTCVGLQKHHWESEPSTPLESHLVFLETLGGAQLSKRWFRHLMLQELWILFLQSNRHSSRRIPWSWSKLLD